MENSLGGHEGSVLPSGFSPNGLLPDEGTSLTQVLDLERWSRAEERIAELISCIQPNQPSEERRKAVASYVQRLMEKCFSCQVFPFGSVPLKTYLPDGDIDLTAFSDIQSVKDTWANEIRDMLMSEEKSDDAEFNVNEVQYIQAEVKIVKCLVENIVVDISFNQLGGLCTLCFLEEVDNLIGKNHLFKRSIILIKAWCYYESRILGAHHGLISTYALETLVLYIFHVYNNSFAGPLEVLYRFLEFFSKFDWDTFCVSLSGPVPISSLPDMTAEPPRKDDEQLLLSKLFLNACSSVYAVSLGGQENQEQPFVSKHFNVIDPLRTNNNLGRSVSKGNFFRIRSAFAFGAQRLARLLDCPQGNLISEVNQFFFNTLDRHGKGHRRDAPSRCLKSLLTKSDRSDCHGNDVNSNKTKENYSKCEDKVDWAFVSQASSDISSQHGNQILKQMSRTSNKHAVSSTRSHKMNSSLTGSLASYQNHQISESRGLNKNQPMAKGRSSRSDYCGNEIQGKYRFARTSSSPELMDTTSEVQLRGRDKKALETGKCQNASEISDNSMRRNMGPEVLENYPVAFSSSDPLSSSNSLSSQSIGAVIDSNESTVGMQMHMEEQDLVNTVASSRGSSFSAQAQMPVNLTSVYPPFPISPSMLASLGYARGNLVGMPMTNFYSDNSISWPISQYIPSLGLVSNQEEISGPVEDNQFSRESNLDNGFWTERSADSVTSCDQDDGSLQAQHRDDRHQFTSAGSLVQSSRPSSSGSTSQNDHILIKEKRGLVGEHYADNSHYQRVGGSDGYSSASSRTKVSSENSLDGSPSKTYKSRGLRQGRKTCRSIDPSAVNGIGKNGWKYGSDLVESISSQTDDNNQEWVPRAKVGTYAEDIAVSRTVPTSHVQIPGSEQSSMNVSNSVLSVAPVLVGSNSQQRPDNNHEVLPFTFYPTGPPVPFLTMLPVYNLPNETGNSNASANQIERDRGLNDRHKIQPDSLIAIENLDQSNIFDSCASVKGSASAKLPEENSDILNSDFASHWQNLLRGRFCQNGQTHGSSLYPSPVSVPPMYLQGHFPWDGPGRPPSGNMNVLTQFMDFSPQILPVSPLPSHGHVGFCQHYADEIPRYRGGTGTYLPNSKNKDRQSSSMRNQRGNYSYEKHGDREGNWSSNARPRFAGNGLNRDQGEKPNTRMDWNVASDRRYDKPQESVRHDSFPSYHSQGDSFSFSNSTNHGSINLGYGSYLLPLVNPSGVCASSPVIMLYPYDQTMNYGSHSEGNEFGNIGSVDLSHHVEGLSDDVNELRNLRGHSAHSSPDQPSSPQFRRSTLHRKKMQTPSFIS